MGFILYSLGQFIEQQIGRCGARILMADTALAQITGAAFARLQRNRCLHPRFGGGGSGLECGRQGLPVVNSILQGIERGIPREHLRRV